VNRRRAAAFAGLVGVTAFMGIAFLPAATSNAAPAVQFGGFDNFGYAAPVSVLVHEPFIPVPTDPQGELRYSYTESTLQSGPFGTATASSVWPGATLATGLPAFNSNLPNYPIQTNAVYPGDKNQTSTSNSFPVPGAGPAQMTASASATKVTASSQTAASSNTSAVSFGQAASTTTDTVQADKVTVDAVATIHNLGLMDGLIGIQSIQSVAHAESNGTKGTASGSQTISGLTVAGQSFAITDKGVQGPSQLPKIPIPGIPSNGAALLARLGISISQPVAQSTSQGTHGQLSSQALLISIDTKTFHDALNQLPIRALIALTPNPCVEQLSPLPSGPCLHGQFDAVLSLSPRIDYLIGNVFASSNGTPQFIVPIDSGGGGVVPPTTTTIPGTPGTPGTPGSASLGDGTGAAPAPQVAGPLTNTSGEFPAGYGGLKGAALLGALAALATWYFIRNMGLAVVGGFAGCEYGAPRTVPDLRRG
jgi:hypothetical protein